jgi:broad specificity phosphatase PhoE
LTTKKTIYLIRHGQTEYNLQGIIQGRGIDSDLNEIGKLQAEAFFQSYQHIKFDTIYTSTLKRTQQSVQAFINLGIPTKAHDGLDEINWGVYEGKKVTVEHRTTFEHITSRWRNGNLDYAPEGGESPMELQDRQKGALEFISESQVEKNILVCMHGRAMRSFLCLMLNKPLELMDDFPHTNLCLYKLVLHRDSSIALIEKNNTSHLTKTIKSSFP